MLRGRFFVHTVYSAKTNKWLNGALLPGARTRQTPVSTITLYWHSLGGTLVEVWTGKVTDMASMRSSCSDLVDVLLLASFALPSSSLCGCVCGLTHLSLFAESSCLSTNVGIHITSKSKLQSVQTTTNTSVLQPIHLIYIYQSSTGKTVLCHVPTR